MADAAMLHGALVRIGWSVESRKNAFTGKGFDSIQSLNTITWLHLKTVCKSMKSTQDPERIDPIKNTSSKNCNCGWQPGYLKGRQNKDNNSC